MTQQERERLVEIDRLIEQLKAEKAAINPYANLKDFNNKTFGEAWSEPYICSQCPSFQRKDQKGWDLWSEALGRVEVKSSRLPCTQITFNQCHPYDCDYFLFVEYDTEEVTESIFLVPSSDFFNFSISVQHSRHEANCFTLSGTTKHNVALLEKYRVRDWAELESLAGGVINGKDCT